MRGAATSRRLAVLMLGGLLAGAAAWPAGAGGAARAAWALTTAAALVPLALGVAKRLLRREVGVDLIALLAMAGALAIGEYLAGAVVALMLAGGQALEAYAGARARGELSALLGRVPRTAHRYQDGGLVSLPVEEVGAGDRLLVKPGEIVPVDGVVAGSGAAAVLDESALTGESRPVERLEGDAVKSGTVNAGGPFDLRAVATAAASTYAASVRLVEEAQASKAPFVRLADRYALVFLPLTLLVAAAAWIAGGSPVRALAVLVVATPCPLILAAPVALIAGVSACARRGVIVKGGGALEALAVGQVLLLDKTGTLTTGVPELAAIEGFGEPGAAELLRLAASLDQVSPHVFAAALVRGARKRGLRLSFPAAVEEHLGAGIRGLVEGRRVALGRLDWIAAERAVPPRAREIQRRTAREGASNVFVAVDGAVAGALILRDPVRADTPDTLRALRRHGIRRVVMVTGDSAEVAETVAAAIGADLLLAECTPEQKVAAVASKPRIAPQPEELSSQRSVDERGLPCGARSDPRTEKRRKLAHLAQMPAESIADAGVGTKNASGGIGNCGTSAAEALNARDAGDMRDGFRTELFNSRGVHGFTAGKEEADLAAKYRSMADQIESGGYHRLATALRELATSYDRYADHEASRDPYDDF